MQPVTRIQIFGVRFGLAVLALYWVLIFTGTHLPKIPSVIPTTNDKVLHFTAFFGLATLLCYCTNSENAWRRFGGIALVCMSYAMLDELTQSLVRGRATELLDFVADTAGALSAITIYAVARLLWRRSKATAKRIETA